MTVGQNSRMSHHNREHQPYRAGRGWRETERGKKKKFSHAEVG